MRVGVMSSGAFQQYQNSLFDFFLKKGRIGPPGLLNNQRDRIKMYEVIKMEESPRNVRRETFGV